MQIRWIVTNQDFFVEIKIYYRQLINFTETDFYQWEAECSHQEASNKTDNSLFFGLKWKVGWIG